MEETVEEIAEKLYPVNNTGSMFMANREQSNNALRQEGFIKGYNLDKERMYSEEDLKEAFKSCYTPFAFDRIGDLEQDFNKWFEQFKKK
jgi:hypothetical protein